MTALEEERLLFEIVTTSLEDRLLLSWQRSDDEGNVVGLSSFVRAFAAEKIFLWTMWRRSRVLVGQARALFAAGAVAPGCDARVAGAGRRRN